MASSRLIRYYIAGTFEFARQHYPEAVPAAAVDGVAFADGVLPEAFTEDDPRHEEVVRTIHMDFGNYTLGRLFDGRSHYDYEHEGHAEATAQVLGVVYDLGWRSESFSDVDSSIGSYNSDRGRGRIERYGKKYGWISSYLVSGMLTARGERVPWLEVDIDPTFPQPSPQLPIQVPTWARPTPKDDRRWMLDEVVRVPDELLYCDVLNGTPGPWILVHAELTATDRQTGVAPSDSSTRWLSSDRISTTCWTGGFRLSIRVETSSICRAPTTCSPGKFRGTSGW